MDTETHNEPLPAESAVVARRPWWWRPLGLRRRAGKRLPIGLTVWGGVLWAGVVFLAGGVGFAEYSMQPDFCRSCHIMEPYYEAWHSSTHRNAPCGDCHFEPGWENTLKGKFQASSQAVKYLTRTYGSKPHAEVRDASCLREGCHERRLLEGKIAWDLQTQRGTAITIRFDHTPHLQEMRRGKKLRCVSCHSQIVQGQHIVVTLDSCFICHFKGLKHGRDEEVLGGCRSCHDAPRDRIRMTTGLFDHAQYVDRGVTCENCHADAIRGDGAVPRQLCWTCHNKPHQLARYNDTAFIHQTHVTDHKVECSHCHIHIEHHLSANMARGGSTHDTGATCAQCHEQSHAGPLELYRGTGGRGVPDMPSAMYRAQVDCLACHQEHTRPDLDADVLGQTYRATQGRCDYCHGNLYHGVLDGWKTTLTELTDRAEAALLRAKTEWERASLSDLERLHLRRELDDAEHNLRLVKLGHGVHNVVYATALLNVALDASQKVMRAVEPGVETGSSGL